MNASLARLCVFMRAPNLGQVKTRLAASVGEQAALAAHIRLVDHLLDQLQATQPASVGELEVQLWLADVPATAKASRQLQRWVERTGYEVRQQQGIDLGQRMAQALASTVADGYQGLLVGSDCPTIDRRYLEQAMSALKGGADVVLGPAEDGGYGLIGVTQAQPALFQDIAWGTDQVLTQTLAKAQGELLNVQLLDKLWDVDELVDWERFCRSYR